MVFNINKIVYFVNSKVVIFFCSLTAQLTGNSMTQSGVLLRHMADEFFNANRHQWLAQLAQRVNIYVFFTLFSCLVPCAMTNVLLFCDKHNESCLLVAQKFTVDQTIVIEFNGI